MAKRVKVAWLFHGTQVKGIPDSKSVYTVDDEGFITVPKGDLPKDKAYENIAVEVKIDGEADFKSSATNTIVPAKMQVRLVINEEKTPTVGLFGTGEAVRQLMVQGAAQEAEHQRLRQLGRHSRSSWQHAEDRENL